MAHTFLEGPLDLGIVGAGRAATALGALLPRAGHRVVAASGREASRDRVAAHVPGARFTSDEEVAVAADAIILGVPDDLLAPTCEAIAPKLRAGAAVVHLSGSASLDVLVSARETGALTLSLHPLQTFPDVESGIERLPGSGFAVTSDSEEGSALGERLARDAGGTPFRLADDAKPLYHSAAVFASNYLAVVEGLAERLFLEAGIAEPVPLFAPLAAATLDNVTRLGPAAALTGPAARGDAGTVRRNLEALDRSAPSAIPAYVALARVACEMAERAGRMDAAARTRVEEVLAAWR